MAFEMLRRLDRAPICFATLLLFTGLMQGCKRADYEIAEVDGQLAIRGKPGANVHIEFIPDAGVAGPASAADTDADGKFVLYVMTRDGSSLAGAVVGSHRVTLSDRRLSESPDGRGVPIRFGPEYTLPGSTPLKARVETGPHTLRLEVR